jgi:serine/threonine protein kinase
METVESVCNQLARSKLLAPEAVRTIHKRWRHEAKAGADDATRFAKWLVGNGFITDFQFGVLQRGFADLLFLDDYKLLDRIGQGRMAGVYKAVHKLGQVVAVKVLPPSKAKHGPTLARFQREARMSLRCKHANVVRTFQVGKTSGGLYYIVMEYLDGDTLEEVLQRRGKLPAGEALHVLLQALRGLGHLHAEGLIHRDLKPGNLMLVPPPRDNVVRSLVKVLDIGLGRELFDEDAPPAIGKDDLTNEGALLGTPAYMAPEQARSSHAADIRSDLYSLGCVLYQCLTGQPPFPDSNVVRQIMRHTTEEARPLREFLPDAAPALQQVMDRLLAKDPAQRFATPAAALAAIEALRQAPAETAPTAEQPLRSYLTWLEQNPSVCEDAELVGPAALLAPQAPPRDAVPVGKPFAPPPSPIVAPASPPLPTPLAESTAVLRGNARPRPAALRGKFPITVRDIVAGAVGAGLMLALVVALWLVWRLVF